MPTTNKPANLVELVLTCASWQEAQRIADHLLNRRLIACAKFLPIQCKNWWEGELSSAKEVMVMMESVSHYFSDIEAEIATLHSYQTFVLKSLPIHEVSHEAKLWLAGIMESREEVDSGMLGLEPARLSGKPTH